ncbi:MAG: TonB-dependent receptor [Porphyromonas sp.]|nr:TonB-dependent receptor [Porphyromonas sp.]
MNKKILLTVAMLIMSIGAVVGQTINVKGVVLDERNEPIIGASVRLKDNASVGTSTNLDGEFQLRVEQGQILLISYVGYITGEVPATATMRIQLRPDSEMLEEVVITGYGTTSKKAFTGAATSVGTETLSSKLDANPIKALSGSVPGLNMMLGSGQPGAPATVYVRGRNSLNSGTQPLYVIDGVPFETGSFNNRVDEGVEISPLAMINSEDIESVTVLKDATATSIYGARAANGVIVITTKKGKTGFSANFTTKIGAATMPNFGDKYRPLSAEDYRSAYQIALDNAEKYMPDNTHFKYFDNFYGHGYPNTPEGRLQWFEEWYMGTPYDPAKTTNWFDEVTRTGLQQNYSLDISGGANDPRAPRYYVSFDYLKDEGIVIGKDLTRYSFRANIDQAPFEFLRYGINTNLSMTESNAGAGGGYFTDPLTQSYMLSPLDPVRLENGEFNLKTSTGYNPVALRSEKGDKNYSKQYRAIINPYVTITFTDWLSFTSRMGLDAYIMDDFGFWSFYNNQGRDMKGMGENGYFTNFYMTMSNTFNINKSWGDHHLNALLGHEGQATQYKGAYLAGSNYPVDYLNDVTLAAKPSSASTNRSVLKLLSYFSNFEYDFANKYYLSASFRYDSSSRFSGKNRWAPFWSVGAKWRLTEEDFMETSREWLNDLTLRSSYGTTGNQVVGSGWYASRGYYDFGYNYNGNPGSLLLQSDNPDLKWEQTAKFNVGLDLRLFNQLTLGADYYYHLTKDMVFAVPISASVGVPTYYAGVKFYENIGQLSNEGLELSLGWDAIQTSDMELRFNLNGAFNKNRIKKLSTELPIESSIQITEVGREINTFKMKEWAGVDPETGKGMWYKGEEGTETTFNYNEAGKRYVGTPMPKVQGGFRTNFRYKGFDTSLQLNYALGGMIYGNNLRYDFQGGSSLGDNMTNYIYRNAWRQPGDVTDVPMLAAARNITWNSHSSRFLMSGDYLKIQSWQIGYTFKGGALKNSPLSAIRVFFNAENLYTFHDKSYIGYDPSSVHADGVMWWTYPQPTKYTGGVTVSF